MPPRSSDGGGSGARSGGSAAPIPAKPNAAPDVAPEVNAHRWWILIGLIMAAALEILDTTVVNVSLPQMAGNLGASTDEIAWVSTGYILSNVIVLPMTAWLSGRFGRKRYLMVSIIIFNIARFMCGLSGSLGEIVFWRLIQGAGGAALISTAQSTIVEIFPRNQTAMVQSLFGLGLIVTPTLGPLLGGYITDNYSWRTVFFIHVPLAIASLTMVGLFLQDSIHQKRVNTVDVPGILMLAAGMGSLQYVLEEGERYMWFDDAWIARLTVVAVVALSGFIYWELSPRNKAPILDLRVLKDRGLSAAVVLGLVLGFGLYGGVFIYPLFVQTILGFTPTATGLALLPGGIATAVGVIFCGRLLSRGFDPRILIIVGMIIYIAAMWMLGHLTPQSGQSDTQLGLLVRGLGLGLVFIPISTTAFASLKGAQIAQGAALYNLMRQLGGSFGIAILTTYVTNMTQFHRYNLVSSLYQGNVTLDQRINGIAGGLLSKGYSHDAAHAAALGIVSHTVQAQAMTMAYNNAFILLGLSFLIATPAVLLLRRPKKGGGAGAGAAH
ncbi:DHA2 family efflux MFS transporter permease subunit [Capsulimonas corticalis]|uniref:DHA2 family efflux MFS transporter permease subunit n=1 Tax=Capsulimonas corticalis TaxID=2219043 RepID=UPI00140362DA|nr:DHA2 family efflux MFS transporter permease subunit [Capsulimonas corticalis]